MSLFYAQQREDEWIANNLSLPDKGFYVDIGCGHPFTTSNTAFLRDRKWQGLAVDADSVWTDVWKDIPAFECAVIASHPIVPFFHDHECPYRSRITYLNKEAKYRKAETIEALLERHKVQKIDLMSIDIEGREFELLTELDFDLHRPSIMIVEYDTAGLGEDLRIEPYMVLDKKYKAVHKTPMNIVFTR
jgi:Methyltransferase FkbM domain